MIGGTFRRPRAVERLVLSRYMAKDHQSVLFVKKHKIAVGIVLVIIATGGFGITRAMTQQEAPTQYVVASVEQGTIISTISGTGQVSASNQVEIKTETAGKVTMASLKNGQAITKGTVLARLDATDAAKDLRSAQLSLESARLELEKLRQPVDAATVLEAENQITQLEQDRAQAQKDIRQAYEDGYNNVADAFLDLPSIVTELGDLIDNPNNYLSESRAGSVNRVAAQYRDDALVQYEEAEDLFDQVFSLYKQSSRASSDGDIELLIERVHVTAQATADAVKDINNLIDYLESKSDAQNRDPSMTTDQATLDEYTGIINSHISALSGVEQSIDNSYNDIKNAELSITQKKLALEQTKAGTDELDLKSAQLTITERQNAVRDAQEKFADYTVTAPFDGIIADVAAKSGETLSSGAVVATLITSQKIAEISLNEVDVAKVAVGQKTTLTFDAVSDSTITGEVTEIDSLGTVDQGVVSYTVKILFDTQDDRIKSGMTVSAAIITAVRQDVLVVPSGAVKTQGAMSYVELFPSGADLRSTDQGVISATPPQQRLVEVGLASDTSVEIVSGLAEGDQVVTRTITSAAAVQASGQQAPSLFGGAGAMRGTGNSVRIQR